MGDQADAALHEATHGVLACHLGKRVERLHIGQRLIRGHPDFVAEGGCELDADGDIDRDDLAILLAAGMYEGGGIAFDEGAGDHGVWPPLWLDGGVLDGKGDRHQVHCIVRLLKLDERDYRDAIAKTRELLAEPVLQLWIARVASALGRKGRLTGDEVEALRPDRLTVELQEAA